MTGIDYEESGADSGFIPRRGPRTGIGFEMRGWRMWILGASGGEASSQRSNSDGGCIDGMPSGHPNPDPWRGMRGFLPPSPRRISLVTVIGMVLGGNLTCAATSKPTELTRSTTTSPLDEDVAYLMAILENTAVPRELRVGAAERIRGVRRRASVVRECAAAAAVSCPSRASPASRRASSSTTAPKIAASPSPLAPRVKDSHAPLFWRFPCPKFE